MAVGPWLQSQHWRGRAGESQTKTSLSTQQVPRQHGLHDTLSQKARRREEEEQEEEEEVEEERREEEEEEEGDEEEGEERRRSKYVLWWQFNVSLLKRKFIWTPIILDRYILSVIFRVPRGVCVCVCARSRTHT